MENFQKIMFHFMCMWVLTTVGLFFGSLLPPTFMLLISVFTILLLIMTFVVRKNYTVHKILYSLPFLIGITLFWSTQFYIDQLGEMLVFAVFIGTVVIFILLAIIGMCLPNISVIAHQLLGALIVVIVFTILFNFITIGNTVLLILAAFTVLIFSIYTIYDFNRIKHQQVNEDEVIGMALNLYLNFINLFLNILEVIFRIKSEFN